MTIKLQQIYIPTFNSTVLNSFEDIDPYTKEILDLLPPHVNKEPLQNKILTAFPKEKELDKQAFARTAKNIFTNIPYNSNQELLILTLLDLDSTLFHETEKLNTYLKNLSFSSDVILYLKILKESKNQIKMLKTANKFQDKLEKIPLAYSNFLFFIQKNLKNRNFDQATKSLKVISKQFSKSNFASFDYESYYNKFAQLSEKKANEMCDSIRFIIPKITNINNIPSIISTLFPLADRYSNLTLFAYLITKKMNLTEFELLKVIEELKFIQTDDKIRYSFKILHELNLTGVTFNQALSIRDCMSKIQDEKDLTSRISCIRKIWDKFRVIQPENIKFQKMVSLAQIETLILLTPKNRTFISSLKDATWTLTKNIECPVRTQLILNDLFNIIEPQPHQYAKAWDSFIRKTLDNDEVENIFSHIRTLPTEENLSTLQLLADKFKEETLKSEE